ncbi:MULTISPECIES: 3-hydroxyacyl-CoA dehydrogenase NAD-binding domain-containing protein [unclassified Saccharopolyspora]|uniref:3-hydroxyacyl-CoA dehydrogenase NAD-binding domain-containing protein n=1 Tax=unclassified Saccharopolyspora TaxID=2646250 RepID=UPI001CD6C3B6|nr:MULTISPECIES: 3-hydroxyacyl-CoA dehydrogenase NAD-binding domain-containing protein [unclassified Saccharopolyspora]MCA1186195.1 L-carnitine dehydrogenase [Saccharopolyspora sp. 6T]MCA1278398.1 L-carnitine dehydrogenase [Saccharopolyspora sp. 7B]
MSRSEFTRVASLGGGVIGQSWTALFLAAGTEVAVFDPDPQAPQRVRRAVETAWPVLTELGLTDRGGPDRIEFSQDAPTAVDGAGFVQESVPERIGLKHELYAAIEPALDPRAVVASSASGLTLTEMQGGWRDPSRFVLGHPFNPPHLIPLVEVVGNERTGPGAVDRARAFYESVGKVTIELKREVPGHVANRLQAALWREAIHLVNEGVASVEDVDTAVSAGPGLRWAAMGPTLLFHLGAGEGGLTSFGERYADSFNRWFDDLGRPHLDADTVRELVRGLAPTTDAHSVDLLARRRDELITRMIGAARQVTGGGS